MEFSGFRAVCEGAAERWQVPALAAGWTVGDDADVAAVGCERETRFRIASITKPFTATTALRLLDLDEQCGVWPDATVGDLLAHVSGYDCECGDVGRFGDGDDALARLVAELPSVRRWLPSRRAWSYSNAGYWIVGWQCAQRNGTTYEDAVYEHVVDAWRLDATRFGDAPDVAGTGHGADDAEFPRARRASGGLVSNVPDLLRFGARQLADESTARLRVVVGKPAGGVYGHGFSGERVGGVDVWGHVGSYGGFQSSLLLVPSHGAVFAGLTNSGRGEQALREIEDTWFEALLGARRRVPETVELGPEELATFEGVYAHSELRADVARADGGLGAEFVELDRGSGEPRERFAVRARPVGPRTFEIVDGDWARHRFDFPLAGFGRFGSRLAERVA